MYVCTIFHYYTRTKTFKKESNINVGSTSTAHVTGIQSIETSCIGMLLTDLQSNETRCMHAEINAITEAV